MVMSKSLRISLVVLSVLLLVGATVFGFVFVPNMTDEANALSDSVDITMYPNAIDLSYIGLPGYPFLNLVTSSNVSSTQSSVSGNYSMSNTDNTLLNNTLSYSFSSSGTNTQFGLNSVDGSISITTSTAISTLVYKVDFGSGYTLPFYCQTYGFSADIFSSGINPSTFLDFPFTVTLVSSLGTSSFNGTYAYSATTSTSNNFYSPLYQMTDGTTLYSMSISFYNLPRNKTMTFRDLRFYISSQPRWGYPYHYATSVLPTSLSTDAYNNGRDTGFAEGRISGFADGEKKGYSVGYNDGLAVSSSGNWYELFSSVFNAPLEALFGKVNPNTGSISGGLFNLSIPLGGTTLNLRNFFIGIFSCLLVVIVIKIVIKFVA